MPKKKIKTNFNMEDWVFTQNELPELGSTVEVAEYIQGDPLPTISIHYVDAYYIKEIDRNNDHRDMWRYVIRETQPKDPYGIPNVCFSLIEPSDSNWDEAKKDRMSKGYDNSELWNLDVTILKFTLPRLKDFREHTNAYPADFKTIEEWKEAIDKMIWWIEMYIDGTNGPSPTDKKYKEHEAKMEECKNLFFKYFTALWE